MKEGEGDKNGAKKGETNANVKREREIALESERQSGEEISSIPRIYACVYTFRLDHWGRI